MSRFYLDLHDCGTLVADPDGVEAPDLAAAHKLALMSIREVMCSEIKQGRLCLGCHIDIRNDAGGVIQQVAFRDAIEIIGA